MAGLSTMGMGMGTGMVQLPNPIPDVWPELRSILAGKEIKVLYGQADRVASLRVGLDLNGPGNHAQ